MTFNDQLGNQDTDCKCHDKDGYSILLPAQDRIEQKLDAVLAISQQVQTIVENVSAQVKPVLDDLMKSPLLKMLGVKSK